MSGTVPRPAFFRSTLSPELRESDSVNRHTHTDAHAQSDENIITAAIHLAEITDDILNITRVSFSLYNVYIIASRYEAQLNYELA